MNEAHDAIRKWMAENCRESAGHSWEIYGDSAPDPADTETTVVYFLKKRSCASGEWSAFRTKVPERLRQETFLRVEARDSPRAATSPSWQMYNTLMWVGIRMNLP
jgi:hypothetical protein